jgi:hypothetical protein
LSPFLAVFEQSLGLCVVSIFRSAAEASAAITHTNTLYRDARMVHGRWEDRATLRLDRPSSGLCHGLDFYKGALDELCITLQI